MSAAEQNYDIHNKELMAIISALKTWRVHAESYSDLTIFTDHKNLVTFTTTKELGRRQVRWSELLGEFKFKIRHTPGKENGRADALSRRPDYIEGKEVVDTPILRQMEDRALVHAKHLAATLHIARPGIQERLKNAYGKDQLAQKLPEENGLKKYQGKVYLPGPY